MKREPAREGNVRGERKVRRCPHLRVIQKDKQDGILMYFHEWRKCLDCGLEEESYFGSYKTELGKAEFIKHVTSRA